MAFWITAAGIAALVGLTIALGFLRARAQDPAAGQAGGGQEARADFQVYRDQLREVDRDLGRGLIAPTDAERLKLEISRRILDADRSGGAGMVAGTPRGALLTGLASVPLIVGLAFLIYTNVGAPGYPDMPLAQRLEDARVARATRVSQAVAEAEVSGRALLEDGGEAPGLRPPPSEEDRALVQRLRDALASRPDDVQGLRLLAVSEAALGEFAAARAAQARVVELLGAAASDEDRAVLADLEALAGGSEALAAERARLDAEGGTVEQYRRLLDRAVALDDLRTAHWAQAGAIAVLGDAATANDFVGLADLLILSAGGYVSPEAEAALEQALQRDPRNPLARYFTGLMLAQTDRPDLAFQLWRQLLEEGPADAPWIAPIRSQIEFMAMRAGVNYTLPPEGAAPARGPSAADIAAAEDMDPEARVAMIEGMVASLAQRLATEGGSAEDWAQLIAAYGVIGREADARAIWTEAQAVFGTRPEALATIREAAERAGVVE
jgi:cytochrome c-type biogenesis protein CcmI